MPLLAPALLDVIPRKKMNEAGLLGPRIPRRRQVSLQLLHLWGWRQRKCSPLLIQPTLQLRQGTGQDSSRHRRKRGMVLLGGDEVLHCSPTKGSALLLQVSGGRLKETPKTPIEVEM